MGPPGSEIWNSMLDGAEHILREEGYAELTSRRVAEHIGVKQRLVYYYFHTMDDLIVETFKRLAARELERLAKLVNGKHALREIWELSAHSTDSRLVSEFIALANRVETLRVEVVSFIKESRRMQVSAVKKAMRAGDADESLPPAVAVIFATGAALLLEREAKLGVRTGHADTAGFIRRFIAEYDD